jgi:hypothetical protein
MGISRRGAETLRGNKKPALVRFRGEAWRVLLRIRRESKRDEVNFVRFEIHGDFVFFAAGE